MPTFLYNTTLDASIAAGAAFYYSQTVNVSTPLTIAIAITSRIANAILAKIIKITSPSPEEKLFNYAATNFIVNMVTIVALRHFDLISQYTAVQLGGLTVYYVALMSFAAARIGPIPPEVFCLMLG